MKEMLTDDDTCLPNLNLIARAANDGRKRLRPTEPKILSLREYTGEDFIIDDIHMEGARHILFGTKRQLELLNQSRRWFVDGTFKVVKAPFYQLMTIHTFLKKGDSEKQFPLAYVLMSRRSKNDYVQVFSSLRRHLGQPLVEWFMLDFEAATWQALREVFPGTIIKGCVFHFTQRVYRKIQEVGLSTAYIAQGDKYQFLRKLMTLPHLPAEQIQAAFENLKSAAESADPMLEGPVGQVINYMDRTWINGTVWKPQNWSVYREIVRTNNDLEGWHRRLNARAGNPNLGIYKLTNMMMEEAATVDLQIRLVSENILSKIRRKKYVQIQWKLEDAWDRYEEEDEFTTTKLLRLVSHINRLGPVTAARNILDDE